jgi:AcrR family transcriptional regulator
MPPKRDALSRERILGTALAIVDREGLESISMRRIGEELGVEAMSLYHHVANKAAVLDGLFETVLAELPPPKRSGSWQAAVRDRAYTLRTVLRAHPNTLPLFATRPAVTPASIAHVEAMLELFRAEGFSVESALHALQVLLAYVVGHSIATYTPSRPGEESRPDYARLDAAAFPRVRELQRVLASYDPEKEFEFGLEAMIAGMEAGLARKPPKRSAKLRQPRRGSR